MATLAGNTIASTYPLLLKIDSSGIDATLRAVEDGDATDSALLLATNKVEVKPGSDDANAFEVSQADGTAVFTVDSSNSRVAVGTNSVSSDSAFGVSGSMELIGASNRYYIPRQSDGALTGSIYSRTGNNVTISGAGSSSGQIEFIPSSANSSAVAMTIDSSQNVGIGAASPGARLYSLTASASEAAAFFLSDNDSGAAAVLVRADSSSGTRDLIKFYNGGGLVGDIKYTGTSLIIDAPDDIYLDAGGGDIVLLDDGTHLGTIKLSSSALRFDSQVSDQAITFTGNDGGSAITAMTIDMSEGGRVGIGTTFGENTASSVSKFAVRSDTGSTHYNMVNIWEHDNSSTGIEQRIGWVLGDDEGGEDGMGFGGYIGVGKQDSWQVDSGRDSYMSFAVAANNSLTESMRISSVGGGSGAVLIAKTATGFTNVGFEVDSGGRVGVKTDGSEALYVNRAQDGTLIEFASANTAEGTIAVSGSTVAYNGFSGNHESSGIPNDTAIGTVVSTIDELDVYPDTDYKTGESHSKAGQTRADHAKIKVSDSVGDKRVYGVLSSFNDDNKPMVASVGIGSIKVTGACQGGDLLESNGDGTAKVQSDDIIKSKTIGKVTIGDSDTSVKLVSCVLYCG